MNENELKENEKQLKLLEERIAEASDILERFQVQFENVDGSNKLKNKIKAELKFLNDLSKQPQGDLKRYVDTSNVIHFRGLLECALRYTSCSAFYKSFSKPNEPKGQKLEVDLVIDGGEKWVKVISRSPRGLAMEFVGAGGGTSRSIVEQAQDYVTMASYYPHFFKTPVVIFEFLNGVPDILARRIESFGISVVGSQVPIEELVTLPGGSDRESDSESFEGSSEGDNEHLSKRTSSDSPSDKEEISEPNTINLDVTAVFALISSLTHGNGANYQFSSKLLNSQAALERRKPALPPLLHAIRGKRMIICRTAFNAVQSILSTVAGPEEKKRAEKLFENVEVVEDRISKRAALLKVSEKISERSKIIFGSGDYYKAVTVTANRHFVSAAAHQGFHFATILHDSRALSEQKQLTSQPLLCDP